MICGGFVAEVSIIDTPITSHYPYVHASHSFSPLSPTSPPSLSFMLPETPVPGLALPEAFESLEQRLDSTLQLSRLGGSPSAQTLGLVTVCQEMERLLKLAFIGQGLGVEGGRGEGGE